MIVAFIGLSFVIQQLERPSFELLISPQMTPVILVGLSLLLGQLPDRKKSKNANRFSLKRLFLLLSWLGVTYLSKADQVLIEYFSSSRNGEVLGFAVLILEYWVLDALCISPISVWNIQGLKQKLNQTFFHLRLQLPLLVLALVQFSWITMLERWLPLAFEEWRIVELFTSLLIIALTAPLLMVLSWGASSLPPSDARTLIHNELADNRVPVTRILYWPEHILSSATAGVIGILPGCRYLMISPRLIEVLSPEEIRAVIAHEAGHLRQHHLLYFAIGFVGFIEFLVFFAIVSDWVQWIANGPAISMEVSILFSILGLILFFRFGFGFLSRNFERQADCHSLERVGLFPFTQALLKVGWLNGINPDAGNWHHFGIRQRLQFLAECNESPQKRLKHHRYITKIKWVCVVILISFLGFNTYVSSTNQVQLALIKYKLDYHPQNWSPEDVPVLTRYALFFQINKHTHEAETVYRTILSIQHNSVVALNNLAWLLTQEKHDDPKSIRESIQLALTALQYDQAAYIWDTLAEGYWKAGQLQKAYQAAQEAWKLAKQGKGVSMGTDLYYYRDRMQKLHGLLKH